MKQFLRRHWIFLAILAFGVFLRSYKAIGWFAYGHDQDLIAWFIRDVLENNHPRLIGQETSSAGVFIGPLFYYLLIPFYFLTKLDPAGGLLFSILVGAFSICSFYFVFRKIFNEKVGLLASLIYSFSIYIVFTDREVVPTMPVMLWSVWFLYTLYLLLKGQKKAYILAGILLGLVWHLNLALLVLSPLLLVSRVLSKKKAEIKFILIGAFSFLLLMLPFFAFETRHNFQQTKAIVKSLTSQKDYVSGTGRGLAKLDRVIQLVNRNTTSLYWDSVLDIPTDLTLLVFIIGFFVLIKRKVLPKNLAIIIFLWQVFYILFFSVNSLNPSEYYFNGMNVAWILILTLLLFELLKSKRRFGILAVGVFLILNLVGFLKHEGNKSGYVERKAVVDFIAKDTQERDYPCLAVSYITSPGNDLGYRHFFFLKKLHVNQPSSGSPVYTIVFPHSKVDRIDKSFGALGLVLPDYDRYNEEDVKRSCSGQNRH